MRLLNKVLLGGAAVSFSFAGIAGVNTEKVMAARITQIRTYKPAMRHTWYAYDHKTHQYSVMKFSKFNNVATYYVGHHREKVKTTLHYRGRRQMPKSTKANFKKYSHWVTGVKLRTSRTTWDEIRGWMQSAGDGDYYAVKRASFNGRHPQVLLDADGASVTTYLQAFRTKTQAKKYANKRIKGIRYAPGF